MLDTQHFLGIFAYRRLPFWSSLFEMPQTVQLGLQKMQTSDIVYLKFGLKNHSYIKIMIQNVDDDISNDKARIKRPINNL